MLSPSMKNCPKCGASILKDALFCNQCGHALNPVQATNHEDNEESIPTIPTTEPEGIPFRKQLKPVSASLLHVQTQKVYSLPKHQRNITLGKPNERVPPDIDLSQVPNAQVVSRVHANICVEGSAFLIEDLDSANGTYVNDASLVPGNRYRLRSGDRISLGKGNKVSFIFQILTLNETEP